MIKPGVHTDISIEDYHADCDYLSATNIKWARKSLSEFHYNMSKKVNGEEQERKSHFDFGNVFELALCDPKGAFVEKVVIREDDMWVSEARNAQPDIKVLRNSKTYQERSKEFERNINGRYVINDIGKESYECIEHMIESCIKDKIINALLANMEYQVSCFWEDPETGIKLKTRPDICKRKNNVIVNVKTLDDGSPQSFSRELAKYDYPLQATIEMRGVIASGLMDHVDKYFWLVCEKSPPYNATIYNFDQKDWGYCDDELNYLLVKLKKAKEQNLWPGYSDRADNQYGILTAEIPLYYRTI